MSRWDFSEVVQEQGGLVRNLSGADWIGQNSLGAGRIQAKSFQERAGLARIPSGVYNSISSVFLPDALCFTSYKCKISSAE